MTRTKSAYLATITVLLAPIAAYADLIDLGGSTIDTSTGLEWLDLSSTDAMSVADALTTFPDYRYANDLEVSGLLASFGITYVFSPGGAYVSMTVSTSQVMEFWSLMGTTWFNNGFASLGGFELDGLGRSGHLCISIDRCGPASYVTDRDFTGGNTAIGQFLVKTVSAVPQPVTIDIKPGSDPNCFNANGHGVIPVAILGSGTFDVTLVDTSSLSFGGLEVRVRGNKGPLCNFEDSDGDNILDLVCHYEDDSMNWAPGDGQATLTGMLLDSTEFEGADSICVVP